MREMVERMARAMAEAEGWRWGNADGPTNMVACAASGQETSRSRDTWRKRAKAALSAMAEPTPAMLDRFVSRAPCVSVHGDGGWSNYGREQWRTMLSAALHGDQEG